MGDVEDADARLALRRVEQALNVQRLALHPALEAGRSDDVVQFHRQGEAVLFGEERVHVEDAQPGEGRLLHLEDHVFQRQVLAAPPGVLEEVGDQHVLAVFDRLDGAPDQCQQRGDDAADLLAVELVIVCSPAVWRGLHRVEDADRQAGIGAGRVDAEARFLGVLL